LVHFYARAKKNFIDYSLFFFFLFFLHNDSKLTQTHDFLFEFPDALHSFSAWLMGEKKGKKGRKKSYVAKLLSSFFFSPAIEWHTTDISII